MLQKFVLILCLYSAAAELANPSIDAHEKKLNTPLGDNQRETANSIERIGTDNKMDVLQDKFDFSRIGFSQQLSDSLNRMYTSSYFLHGFFASLAVIIVSELGDKTFFIAAIMAMRHSRFTILSGALSALALMTVLASLVGHVLSMIPHIITYYASSILLLIFGVKMFLEAKSMSANEGMEEMEEVQMQLKKSSETEPSSSVSGLDPEKGVFITSNPAGILSFLSSIPRRLFSKVFLQAFTLTFLAEWGDRSQMATVILAAREHVGAVIIGGTLGHAFCTGLAVIGGRMIAQRISVKAVTYIGSIVFLLFGLSAFFFGPESGETSA